MDDLSTSALRLNGARPRGITQRDAFYPTPMRGIKSLLEVERFASPIWEPACGDGAISRVLQMEGYEVISTDLVDRGYGTPRIDFLMEFVALAPTIITNPPFKLGGQFTAKALELAVAKVAMLLPLRFLEGVARGRIFDLYPLSRVWVFRRRLAITSGDEGGSKGGMISFAWFIWDRESNQNGARVAWLK